MGGVKKVAAEIYVSGRVQGVGYRFFTERAAAKYNVRGWSMNLPDGRVALDIEATDEDAGKFIQELEQGPPMARVEEVKVSWKTHQGKFSNFTIKV
jgi:acylphosphatase